MKYYWDRVKETTSSSGTSDHTLTGAVTGFLSFSGASIPNGTIVQVLAIAGSQWEVSEGAYNSGAGTVARTRILASSTGAKVSFSGSPTITIAFPAEQLNYTMSYRRNFITGFTFANDTTDANNDIVIQPGVARDRTDADDIELLSALIKQLDASWAVGTNAGGRLEGSAKLNSQMYAIWALRRTDTNVTDVGFSTALAHRTATVTMTIASPGVITWTNHGFVGGEPIVFTTTGALPTGLTAGTVYFVLAASIATDTFRVATTQGGTAINTTGSQSGTHTGTSTPTLPSNYTLARRIGFIRTDSSGNILPFFQEALCPSVIILATSLSDLSIANSNTTATRTLVTSLGPPNCELMLLLETNMISGSAIQYGWVRSPSVSDTTPTSANSTFKIDPNSEAGKIFRVPHNVISDHGRRYAYRKTASNGEGLGITALLQGWRDERLP